jgi:hypothetical protein
MSIKFLTFGSHDNYIDAGKRLLKQSIHLNIFTESIFYTGEDLKCDIDFWNKHGDFITNNQRGYGYWLWKSYLIQKTMASMNNGDILLYLDCGCELVRAKKDNLLQCIDLVKTDKIIYTHTRVEKHYNKKDLVVKLDMNQDIYLETEQRQAGALLFLVCDETRAFVDKWYELCSDYHNIDDSPSILPNIPDFYDHRHDQAIFSLLSKKYKFDSTNTLYHAIDYARNKTGVSFVVE